MSNEPVLFYWLTETAMQREQTICYPAQAWLWDMDKADIASTQAIDYINEIWALCPQIDWLFWLLRYVFLEMGDQLTDDIHDLVLVWRTYCQETTDGVSVAFGGSISSQSYVIRELTPDVMPLMDAILSPSIGALIAKHYPDDVKDLQNRLNQAAKEIRI